MASSGSTNLANVLEALQSSDGKSRERIFKDLKHVFELNRNNNALLGVKEKSILLTFEQLFQIVALERATWIKVKARLASAAADRLTRCADAFRATVEFFRPSMRPRTVKAVLNHIIQTLPMADGGLCKPMIEDYFKALKSMFDYQPHAEHLDPETWFDIVDFCMQSIALLREEEEEDDNTNSHGVSHRTTRARRRASDDFNIDILVECMRSLVLPANCPLSQNALQITSCICDFLKTRSGLNATRYPALEIIDACILSASKTSVKLLYQIADMALPLIRTFWSAKEQKIRDRLLSILVHLQKHLSVQASVITENKFTAHIQSILETMQNAFHDSIEKNNHLSLDDLVLTTDLRDSEDVMPLQIPTASLKQSSLATDRARRECNWTFVAMIAFCSNWLDVHNSLVTVSKGLSNDLERSPKRRRTSSNLENIILQLSSAKTATQLRSRLQILLFITSGRVLHEKEMDLVLDGATQCMSNDKYEVVPWAMLLLASCAFQPLASLTKYHSIWIGAWQLCNRGMSAPSSCRTACHLGNILITSKILTYDDIKSTLDDYFFSESFSGPSTLCDPSLALWSTVSNLRAGHVPGPAGLRGFQHMLSWMRTKWLPSSFENKTYIRQLSSELSASVLIAAFDDALGRHRRDSTGSPFARLGDLGQAWRWSVQKRSFMNWLLLFNDRNAMSPPKSTQNTYVGDQNRVSDQTFHLLASSILSHLSEEVDKALERWLVVSEDRVGLVSGNMLQSLFTLCLTGNEIAEICKSSQTKDAESLRTKCDLLAKSIIEFIAQSDTNLLPDMILIMVAPLLSCALTRGISQETIHRIRPFASILENICHYFQADRDESDENTFEENDEDDLMFDSPTTTNNQKSKSGEREPQSRLMAAAISDLLSFRVCMIGYCKLLVALCQHSSQNEHLQSVPQQVFTYVQDLPDRAKFAALPLLYLIRQSRLEINPVHFEALLVHYGKSTAKTYEWTGCELAACFVVEIMSSTVSLWTDDQSEDLRNLGSDYYEWILEKALQNRICSTDGMVMISDLLFNLLLTAPGYAESFGKVSIRTSLFELLKDSDIFVQYHITQRLPAVFQSFILAKHFAIFDDIVENLPRDVEHIEGICIRLTAFASIGGSWKNLLHISLYNIFDTVSNINEVSHHGRSCVNNIVNQLDIQNGKQLFRLFSSQILYTWLEKNALSKIPYEIFGYSDLKELVLEVRQDLASLCVMRGNLDQSKELQFLIQKSEKEILASSFSQAAVFAVANDISNSSHEAETRLREPFGKIGYGQLLATHFQSIVAHLFLRLEHEESFERIIAKRPGYDYAVDILQFINQSGQSLAPLSQSQQPSWSPVGFLDQLERLCRRVNRDVKSIWTPTMVIGVGRILFSGTHKVYGPTHTCRIIQRIKVLLCLAGAAACSGYPLQMLLRGLGVFVTDKYTSSYAIPLIQYLLTNGDRSLIGESTFVAELCMPMLLSMRNLLDSEQDSTTQESIHKEMLSRAQKFRNWLNDYITHFRTKLSDDTTSQSFLRIMDAARNVSRRGSAARTTSEGRLLRMLLEESFSNTSFLNTYTTKACIRILGQDFDDPPPIDDDIIDSEVEASRLACVIWESTKLSGMHQNYIIWASRALGHAFLHDGKTGKDIALESDMKSTYSGLSSKSLAGDVRGSKQKLIRLIHEQISNPDSSICGQAESALNSILLAIEGSEDFDNFTHALPKSFVDAFLKSDKNRPDRIIINPIGNLKDNISDIDTKSVNPWIKECVLSLLQSAETDAFLRAVEPLITDEIVEFPQAIFPLVLHIVLNERQDRNDQLVNQITEGFDHCFRNVSTNTVQHIRLLINALLYLRMQRRPRERSSFERNQWLTIDLELASSAAQFCGLSKTALMLFELSQSNSLSNPTNRTSRRSMQAAEQLRASQTELIVPILRSIDEPDAFYGIDRSSDLDTIADRLDYEGDDVNSLLFRGARADGVQRMLLEGTINPSGALLPSLTKLSLNSLVNTLVTGSVIDDPTAKYSDCIFTTAIKLGRWDLPTSALISSTDGILYRTLQDLNNIKVFPLLAERVHRGFLDVHKLMMQPDVHRLTFTSSLQILASLAELSTFVSSSSPEFFESAIENACRLRPWMNYTSVDQVSFILASREAFTGILKHKSPIRQILKLRADEVLLAEARLNLQSTRIFRELEARQESLSSVTYLSYLVDPLHEAGYSIDAVVKTEIAHVLWDRGELGGSIRTLRNLCGITQMNEQTIPVVKAGILANLAHHTSHARLEKPDDILTNYLRPALRELRDQKLGAEAGKVFHEYAAYCHNQLDNRHTIQELHRSERFVKQKESQIGDLRKAITTTPDSNEKREIKKEHDTLSKWLKIDQAELLRLQKLRHQLLRSSLDNYLQALAASDEHDIDAIRFLTIWFSHAENESVNEAVREHSLNVPSRKFVSVMNQLGSRLQDVQNDFQKMLGNLVQRVCEDHPYHSMHHIFAGSCSSTGHDSQAQSRQGAAARIAALLKQNRRTSDFWMRIQRSDDLYNRVAKLRSKQIKQGAKLTMKDFDESKKMIHEIPALKIPPITMKISVRNDCNYSTTPVVTGFRSEISVPGGNSAPKIVTANASDGKRYRQLFKGGQDDLRQDAIMEQVFEQVTNLLKHNRATRRRNLSIRTYNVIPLDSNSGAIEFVEPTMSLMDFLEKAHLRYCPKDLAFSAARQKMFDARDKQQTEKIRVYEDICARFSPVLRHFFFEKFLDPEDWFERRLAYTRSTATISILGHVLGLGDRHCQNILLDTKTGEVIHIDLGVAFEAGRILPKPETVPFRLTRDIVDGFGVLKTEGVFRRCCEFTLEALRQNKEIILTLLNVLRYDPLYSWSVSPLRAKRLQNEQESRLQDDPPTGIALEKKSKRQEKGGAGEFELTLLSSRDKSSSDDGGEADRALTTVERKLSGGLSVSATVNELIQQATDEKNLAVLFHGWAPFA